VNDEQKYLYSFMPRCAPGASDPEQASGMSVDHAWKRFTTGRSDTVIAYVEAGINWHDQPEELANRVFLNRGELPPPTTPKHDGQLNASDYADTKDANGNGLVDPEDIIKRFSDGRDDDGNGYTDDISGWDFYDDQNDPATVDSAYGHANGQMRQAASETNNGTGEAGICPHCMIMPVKAGAEALDRTDDLAQAWLYASDMNAGVIVSTTADLGYSTFMSQAVNRVWKKGTIMVESSNDFDSTDHQGGMFHQHVIPGNGMVANSNGIPDPAVANAETKTYRVRSGETSWGPHNIFTAATNGGSTSESTPTIGGVMGLVLSYGKIAAAKGLIDHPLTNDEAIQVVRATASDVTSDPITPLGWPAKPGFDLQYGYGRPNVYKAMQAIHDGDVPPEAWIGSPGWYRRYDPTRTDTIPVRGHVAARWSHRYSYKVEFAPGAEPANGDFMPAGGGGAASSGGSAGSFNGTLGRIDLSRLPKSFWDQARNPFQVSQTKTLESSEQYTVTIRLRVKDAQGRVGEDRRAIEVTHDPSLAGGYPKRIGPGGESQPALADLQGRGDLAMVFGDADGRVHAIDGRTGHELHGWPVHTRRTKVTVPHPGVDPGHEPVLADVAVADLKHNGHLDVVVTSTTGRVYVWNSRGHMLHGWPKRLHSGVHKPPIPRPEMPHTRLPVQGATAAPILADLDGNGTLEIVQAGWDGRLHVWKPSGKKLSGWPVEVKLPDGYQPKSGYFTVQDHKLDAPPAIGDLDGDGKPEIVERSQYTDLTGDGVVPAPYSHVHAYEPDGTAVPGFPISALGLIGYYGSAQEFITEGVSIPTLADVNGDGADEIAFAPGIFSQTYLYDGNGSEMGAYGPFPTGGVQIFTGGTNAILDVLAGNLPDDTPVNFTTAGAFGKLGATGLNYAEPGSGGASVAASLLLTGSGVNVTNYERAFNAQSGAVTPGFPVKLQGLDFLGTPIFADVTGDGKAEILNAADSAALQGFTDTGTSPPGFPKYTGGWVVFAPAVGDINSNGKSDLVAMSREGYLYVWRTKGDPTGNDEWWRAGHDEWNTDEYGRDTRPPGKLRSLRKHPRKRTVTFKAPGDDWYAGRVDHYLVKLSTPCHTGGGDVACPAPPPPREIQPSGPAGTKQSVKVPRAFRRVRVQAVDEAGNLGPAKRLRLRR
jgi:hypothetical protein